MKDITQRFHAIYEERKMFELHPMEIVERQRQHQPNDDEWRQTTSIITEPKVYGRDEDREQIVEFLLRHASNSEDLSIYPIVGMGGLGKTTLAQMVFNDHRVTNHFDLKIWVCIFDDFGIKRILQSIIDYTTPQNANLKSLELMQKKVQEVLQSKRYLLVLDDVWNEDQVQWNKLKFLLQCRSGTKGSSILVTTRLENAASIMGTHPAHRLSGLSEDDNWSLFKHHAFGSNKDEREEFVAIGKEIVRNCAGSPLASKVLGSLLHTKREVKQWLNVEKSKFWGIPEDNSIMRALRLSYYNLKLPSRQCFSFCALFPKGFGYAKEHLIHLWMANGFIQSRGILEVEDVGNEVWNELYQRSFFQEIEIDVFGNITFKLHDLFHDLAQSIMGEECVVSRAGSFTDLPSRLHHICTFGSSQQNSMFVFKKVESLRTYLDIDPFYTAQLLFRRLPSISHLRALCSSASQLSTLKKLTHLRYLKIYDSNITTLPESICRLRKLQILELENCDYLYCLPKHLTQLQDLRHLIIKRCESLEAMPPNIGRLACLKTLSTFIVDSEAGFGLAELHDLKLGGKLHIRGLENVNGEGDAKQANLISKNDLNQLYLSWGSNSPGTADAERVLEALQPHSNLKSLGLDGYEGIQFPNWMRNPFILQGIVHLILYKCTNCERLPPLGKLPHLTTLHVSGMKDVKHLDDDSYDDVSLMAFKSLKKLILCGLPNLEMILREERVEMLPLLSKLDISQVPKLKLPCLSSVESLGAKGIEDMASFSVRIVQNMPRLKTLHIGDFSKLKVLPDELGSLNELEELQIYSCNELESFPEHVLQGLSSLRTLDIRHCQKLKSLSKGLGHLSCLERLVIWNCPEFVSMPNNMNQLIALRDVMIGYCCQLPDGFKGIPFLQRLSVTAIDSLPEWLGEMTSLRVLDIRECQEMTSLPNSISQLTDLQELHIESCFKLRTLPSSFSQLTNLRTLYFILCIELMLLPSSFSQLTNLEELHIYDCPKIEKLDKRGRRGDWKKITHVPQMEIRNSKEEMSFSDIIRFIWKGVQRMNRDRHRAKDDYMHEFTEMVDRLSVQ